MNDARLSARSECYGTALRKASRCVTALYDETLAPSGLRSTQFAILAEIVDRDEGPPTLNQLADDLVLDRSGLGHSLRPLEREGLIRLEKSSTDRRSTLVALRSRPGTLRIRRHALAEGSRPVRLRYR